MDSTPFTYVEVVDGEVGSSISLSAVAAWAPAPVGSNIATGTVTTVDIEAGQEVTAGSILYTVNLRPVVIAQGSVPSFESLSQGSSGADVSQLQTLLTTLGFYSSKADGSFSGATQRAVIAWQKSLGVKADGVVQAGDIIYVPSLPTRISLDATKVKRGAVLGGGEDVVLGLPPTPTFTVPVTSTQAGLISIGGRVEITGPEGQTWQGFIAEQLPSTTDDSVTLTLTGAEGKPICGDDCKSVPVSDQALLRAQVITVENVKGLTVPSAALFSKADGTLAVTDEDGVEHSVTVTTSARGISVIQGAAQGTHVRVPAK
ncbi:peptidoglycan-binding domain-containing protein [Subtercola boreus]|uniref:peptidoglycan-binding domain-containing protein n=1 Tax=Subtercola boreus TaxID=120213 RepID=UPI0015595CEA|nr:peptidoglycan-binding protein [Subtercola boreus]